MPFGNRQRLRYGKSGRRADTRAFRDTFLKDVQSGQRRRQLDADVRRPLRDAMRHIEHRAGIAGFCRVHLGTDQTLLAAALLKQRVESLGQTGHDDADDCFRLTA